MLDLGNEQLKLYSNVVETPVDWLWYPYIPFGKITLIQGDPGCGKSTLMMSIISAVTNGSNAPDGRKLKKPILYFSMATVTKAKCLSNCYHSER